MIYETPERYQVRLKLFVFNDFVLQYKLFLILFIILNNSSQKRQGIRYLIFDQTKWFRFNQGH